MPTASTRPARRSAAQADPGAGPVLDQRGHDRGAAPARARRRGSGHVPNSPRRRLEEAEVVPLRLELLQGHREDMAALRAGYDAAFAAAICPARRAFSSSSTRFASMLAPP